MGRKKTFFGTVGTGGTGNTKCRRIRARGWCFTINNPISEDFEILAHIKYNLPEIQYCFGLEGTTADKTTHIQGFVYFQHPQEFKKVKSVFDRGHIEKAKGNKKQNYNYCSKEGNFDSNMYDIITPAKQRAIERVFSEEYNNITWKPWQQSILDMIKNPPHKRKIYWYWEPTGNVGKSFLVKYICMTHTVIIGEGKMADVFNQINTIMTDDKKNVGKIPQIIIIDVPRTSIEFINYAMIEKVKNGCIYSGKYEGGICIFPIPHIIVFANEEPKLSALSADRLEIIRI